MVRSEQRTGPLNDPAGTATSADSVYGNAVVGVLDGASPPGFQALVDASFGLSNVISGNGANGIELSVRATTWFR